LRKQLTEHLDLWYDSDKSAYQDPQSCPIIHYRGL